MLDMHCTVAASLEGVPAAHWNRLVGADNPFVRHEFLVALERNGCVGEKTGWLPRHLLLRAGAALVGAAPLYVKYHSYGEYVFDWAWADAYARYGVRYYPKLVAAVPYTPVTGPRLLTNGVEAAGAVKEALIQGALELARDERMSSLHWLFPGEADARALDTAPLLSRMGYQLHWHNRGFRDFEDFLEAFRSKKRKEIRRERRQAGDAGVEIEMLEGTEIGEAEWRAFHHFYCSTYDRKWGMPYLTLGFFQEIGRTMPEAVLLVLARRGARYVAGALCLRGAEVLYGRNWGCAEYHPALHYEMCYYRTVEYCIRHRLARFEAGAQGDYKLSRGLLPVATRSAHWVRHPQFRAAIAAFLEEERAGVRHYMEQMQRHSPYRREHAPARSRAVVG